jgi:hypothetical protein
VKAIEILLSNLLSRAKTYRIDAAKLEAAAKNFEDVAYELEAAIKRDKEAAAKPDPILAGKLTP